MEEISGVLNLWLSADTDRHMTSGLRRQFTFFMFIPETLNKKYERVLQECEDAIREAREVLRLKKFEGGE